MNLTDIVNYRYSTKSFNADKKITDAEFQQIKDLLQLSPSSVNSQPWHFVIANTDAGKARISVGTQGTFAFNQAKVLDASHVVLFCAKTEISDEYMQKILTAEDNDGRFADPSFKNMVHAGRTLFVNMHRYDFKDAQHWMEKQLYLNMGTVLLGAAALGIDAVPMEGIDCIALDQEFGLREQGYTAVAVVSFGYRKDSDFNASLPKSRFPQSEIFTEL